MKWHEYELQRQENLYYLFSGRDEWELGQFLYTNFMQSQIDGFLKLKWVRSRQPKVIQELFGNPIFSLHMEYDPCVIFDGLEWEYSEWMSSDKAHWIQDQLPESAVIVPALVTRMTSDLEMHPLFITIANIHSNVCMKAMSHAWFCVHPNFQSQQMITCVSKSASLVTLAKQSQFGDDIPYPPHKGKTTLKVLYNLQEFLAAVKAAHLSGVQLPFWQDWHFSDPSIFLTGEILHTCHKFFFDHLFKWCKELLGSDELECVGVCHFNSVLHVKQMTRCDHQDLQHTIIVTIAGIAEQDFVHAICTLINFIYQAQSPTFTELSIHNMEGLLSEFHKYKGKSKEINHFWIPKLKLLQSFGCTICNIGSLIQYTVDVSKHLLITHCKDPFSHTNRQHAEFTQQIMLLLNHEESIQHCPIMLLPCITFLELYDKSFLNNFSDKEWYYTMQHSDDM
ncbi:hypothetical protein V8B97DRAFT_2022669 [Scleroderma yunnanense]